MIPIHDFEMTLPDSGPYIEKTLKLYETAVQQKRGRIVFITAEVGGGNTELLNAIIHALHRTKPDAKVVAGFFRGGEYYPQKLNWDKRICFENLMQAVGETAALIGLVPSIYAFAASFVGQLLQTIASALNLRNDLKGQVSQQTNNEAWLREMLRRTATTTPLICALNDWHEAKRFYWDNMLLSFSKEIPDLPLLMFLTLKEPIDLDAPAEDESGLTLVIKTLTESGIADLWRIPKLSREEIANWIGPSIPTIPEVLHQVTDGNANSVQELWQEWRLNEIVVRDATDSWVWNRDPEENLSLYNDIVRRHLIRLLNAETAMEIEEAREVLACGALEGRYFTADAVALALGWDRDELIDFLDEKLVRTDDNPNGILLEIDSLTIPKSDGSQNTLWRYWFVSELHWLALERYGFFNERRPGKEDSQKGEMTVALVTALDQTYAPGQRFVAASLARLMKSVGQPEVAQHYHRMATYLAARESTQENAFHLLTINKDDWERWRRGHAARFLIEAGKALFDTIPHHDTGKLFEEASKLANEADYKIDEAYARYWCGFVFSSEGDIDSAKKCAMESLRIFRLIGKKRGISTALSLLGELDLNAGRYESAHKRVKEAMRISRELGDHRGKAVSLTLLAQISFAQSCHAEARREAREALKIWQTIGEDHGAVVSMQLLARIDYLEQRYDEASVLAKQSFEILSELGNRSDAAVSLNLLAHIAFAEGRYDEARRLANQSLEIDQEIGHRDRIAMSLYLLSNINLSEGRIDEARRLAAQSFEIFQEIGNPDATVASMELLAKIHFHP